MPFTIKFDDNLNVLEVTPEGETPIPGDKPCGLKGRGDPAKRKEYRKRLVNHEVEKRVVVELWDQTSGSMPNRCIEVLGRLYCY